jgi:uncharacterized cupin superfamily protein
MGWLGFFAVASIALLVLLALAHARANLRLPAASEDLEILQATVSTITPEMLAERRPIVIIDRIAGDPVESLATTVFRWQHMTRTSDRACRMDAFERSRARFTLVHYPYDEHADSLSSDGGAVVVKPAGDEAHDGVAVLLSAGRVLVLPPGWRFLPLVAGARRARLDDLFTAVASPFLSTFPKSPPSPS